MNEIELEFTKLVREYRKTIYTQNVDMARQPEHLLQSGAREETECTNRSVAYRQGCFE